MPDRYVIVFAPAGLDYVRQVIGQCKHDEVRLLIDSIEQQRREQDAPPAPAPSVVPLHAVESGRRGKARRSAADDPPATLPLADGAKP
jgi:hypothetical protein